MMMWREDVEGRTEDILSGNKNKEEEGEEENDLCRITKRKMYLL